MSRRKTTEEFVSQSKQVHGNKYDYSLVEYKNSYTKVKIICPDHDVFEQAPRNHLSGYGCSKCSGFILTTYSFINKAKDVHGDKYDYSLVDYKGSSIKVKIICDKKHIFNMRPNNHLTGQGCPKCTGRQKVYSELIEGFKSIHGNRYDYSIVDYKGCDKKIKIICPIHDVFNQTPNNHYRGAGCPKCGAESAAKKQKKTTEEFIELAKSVHSNKYDYSKVNYISSKSNIQIICNIHGMFEQNSNSHIQGHGCNECSSIGKKERASKDPTGWNITNWDKLSKKSKNFDSFKVYIIRCWNDSEQFYKVGRTFATTKKRFSNKTVMPYNYEILKEFIFKNAKDAYNKETELKRLNKKDKYVPELFFGGRHECFSVNPLLE